MTLPESDIDNSSLDPADWNKFRQAAHFLLDRCVDRLSNARQYPWEPVPESIALSYKIDGSAGDLVELVRRLSEEVLPYGTGNTHPAFFGWVHGSGLASGLLSELVAATMDSNCGGRDHGMSYMERAVVDWARQVFGLPETASGLLVAGTSQATVIALAAARLKVLGPNVRKFGHNGSWLTAYSSEGSHNAIRKAMELIGLGGNNLRIIAETDKGVDVDGIRTRIHEDRCAGATPFAIIGTAGSVNHGRFDDLNALAELAKAENLWLHVDGAFGSWLRLASSRWRKLVDGIELADSIACDFHKWMYVPYDCGLALIRDESIHRETFAARPSYLASQQEGLGGGEPWYCDYGVDLSRGNRALKVWTALQHYGMRRLGEAITENCKQAAYMGHLITSEPKMQLAAPVISNVCVFTADATISETKQSGLNQKIACALQLDGKAVFSTTQHHGVNCLRAAITNHRTAFATVLEAIESVKQVRDSCGTFIELE